MSNVKFQVNSLNDLRGKKVLVISGTTSENEMKRRGFNFEAVASIEAAVEKLKQDNDFSAIVYDEPVLEWVAAHDGKLIVTGNFLKKEYYSVAINKNNIHFLKLINIEILRLREGGYLSFLDARYFGKEV